MGGLHFGQVYSTYCKVLSWIVEEPVSPVLKSSGTDGIASDADKDQNNGLTLRNNFPCVRNFLLVTTMESVKFPYHIAVVLWLGLFPVLFVSGCSKPPFENDRGPDGTHKQPVVQGIERLFKQHLDRLRGKNIGLVVNQTSVDRNGTHLVDRLMQTDAQVEAIFAPEHGFRGQTAAGQTVQDGTDPVSGAQVYSVYGERRRPAPETLKGLDVLIYDIQDVGVRCYTYISTLGYSMQAAARQGIPFWVLERPNPITGSIVEGPVLKNEYRSFVGLYPIPMRYGMTSGELARMIVGEEWLAFPEGFQPTVIEMTGWERDEWMNELNLPWTAPSPNIPRLTTAVVYPGMVLLEGTNVSEGRGTDHPFEWVGAPWISGKKLVRKLNKLDLPGVRFDTVTFTPEKKSGQAVQPAYEGERCKGAMLNITDRDQFRAVRTGVSVLWTIHRMYPESFRWKREHADRLFGGDGLRTAIEQGKVLPEVRTLLNEQLESFREKRRNYLLR